MNHPLKTISVFTATVFGLSLIHCVSIANAKPSETSVLVNKPAGTSDDGPTLAPPAKSSTNKPLRTGAPAVRADESTLPPPKRPFMRPAEPREPARGHLA